MRILLNIAHTDDTQGKRSPDGKFREWVFSTEICWRLHDELVSEGYEVDVIKQKTYFAQSKGLTQVVKDVNRLCDKYGKDNCLLVSIHVNAAGNGTTWKGARGWEVYTSKGSTNSDLLAEYLHIEAEKQGFKMRGIKEEDFYILRATKCIAALTENLFMDNEEDLKILMSDEGKRKIIDLHKNAIKAYICSQTI